MIELLQLLRRSVLLIIGGVNPHVLQSEVVEEGVLVLVDRTAIHMVATGGEDQSRLFELFRFIQSIDAVDGALELAGKSVIIDGRGQDDHLRLVQQRVDILHIVLLDALTFMAAVLLMAVFTGKTPGDLLLADIHHGDNMAVFLRALPERLHHGGGVAVGPGTAIQHKDLHRSASQRERDRHIPAAQGL